MRKKYIYLVIIGKRPVAAFKTESKAYDAITLMQKLYHSYELTRPRVEKVEIQD